MVKKRCSCCKKFKEPKDFYKRSDGRGKDGLQSRCKKYVCKATIASSKKNPKKTKARHLKWRNSASGKKALKNYNLKRLCGTTIESYEKLLDAQNGCCAICGVHQSELDRSLHQDHNHISGSPRGLLCFHCNSALGQLDVDSKGIELLLKAIEYVRKYNE